ncbi:hypothetical protein ACIPYR_02680 [Streptomyces parvus]|uniref:hypothetical protein n=1 Tax=Streptomyces parvus TaxID=66428 RepID=UPI0038215A97
MNVLPQEGLVYPIYYLFKEMDLYDGELGYTILVGITYSAFVLLISNDNQTVPLGLSVMQGQYTSDPTAMSAAALLGIVPMVIFQRSLTRGMTAGSVK